ncbi:MAG: phosphatase PAP2 family protein, partial [Myxococcales bacterium]
VLTGELPVDERDDANAGRSFFSGHVANTVAATVATTRAFQRLGRPGLAWTMFGVGMAGSTMVGISRVGAGSHFPSDVLVGAAIGAGIGILVPALHGSGRRPTVQAVPIVTDNSAYLSLTGVM